MSIKQSLTVLFETAAAVLIEADYTNLIAEILIGQRIHRNVVV